MRVKDLVFNTLNNEIAFAHLPNKGVVNISKRGEWFTWSIYLRVDDYNEFCILHGESATMDLAKKHASVGWADFITKFIELEE